MQSYRGRRVIGTNQRIEIQLRATEKAGLDHGTDKSEETKQGSKPELASR
jgi:hypothetical protein